MGAETRWRMMLTCSRAERAAQRRRDHQLGVHDAGHRRQHDRKLGLEELDNSAIRPHDFCSRRLKIKSSL
jgi:hypothetical protein